MVKFWQNSIFSVSGIDGIEIPNAQAVTSSPATIHVVALDDLRSHKRAVQSSDPLKINLDEEL